MARRQCFLVFRCAARFSALCPRASPLSFPVRVPYAIIHGMRKLIADKAEMKALLAGLAAQVAKKMRLKHLAVIGIRRRGEVLARRLHRALSRAAGRELPFGSLDIAFYRDDFSTVGANPVVSGTDILFPVEGMDILLVDDVLSTGRTVRAALDQLVDLGRPASVRLLVLVDREQRELPIAADFVGKRVRVGRRRMIEVRLADIDGKDEVIVVGA